MSTCGVCGEDLPDLIAQVSTWTVESKRKWGGRKSCWAIEVRHHPGCTTAIDCVPMIGKVTFAVQRTTPAKP